MRRFLSGILMALSTYSIIPVPISVWRDDVWPMMAVFLPAVGAVTGLIWFGIALLLTGLGVPALILAAVMCLYPHIITGFFHLDGYMDCADAVMSRRDLETRRKILKDSHIGAFAVIALFVLLIVTFSFWAEMGSEPKFAALIFAPVMCRCVSAWSVTMLRPLSTSQYSGAYRDGVNKKYAAAIVIEFVIAAALSLIFGCGIEALTGPVISAVAVLLLRRSFDGMCGDIAGSAVTLGEAAASIAVVISSLI